MLLIYHHMRRILERGITAFGSSLALMTDLPRRAKHGIVIVADMVFCLIATWLSFSIRFGIWQPINKALLTLIVISITSWLICANISRVYKSVYRYSGGGAVINLAVACIMMVIPMTVIVIFVVIPGIPRTLAVLQPLIFLLLLASSRIFARYLFLDILGRRTGSARKPILIYGAGRTGQQLANSLRYEPDAYLAGFLDNDPKLVGQRIDGVDIHAVDRLPSLLVNFPKLEILLALPNISAWRRKEIISTLSDFNAHVRTVPSMSELMDGKASLEQVREIQIEDLLGRAPVQPDSPLLRRTVANKVVLVTGGGGSIGSELSRQIMALDPKTLILVDQSEFALFTIENELLRSIQDDGGSVPSLAAELCNVADPLQVDRALAKWRPDTIFHAAAFKHVPLVESNVVAAARNNILGTHYMATSAERNGVGHFILVSTDKAVRPTNVMGATKRVCELILQAINDRGSPTTFSMVRFGNVLGSSGSVVPLFIRQIREGGPVTITDRRVTRYFMTIPEASQLVIQAGGMAQGGEVFVLDMGEAMQIAELARVMIRLSGMTERTPENPEGDIEIREIGLRPGEKLYEELLIGDQPISTSHERIMKAREDFIHWPQLTEALEKLDHLVNTGDSAGIRILLSELVVGFPQQGTAAADSDTA